MHHRKLVKSRVLPSTGSSTESIQTGDHEVLYSIIELEKFHGNIIILWRIYVEGCEEILFGAPA